jgi:hypothetical protein
MASEIWSDVSDKKDVVESDKSNQVNADLPSFYSSIRKMIKGFQGDNHLDTNERFLFNGVQKPENTQLDRNCTKSQIE